jgi:HAD superfamily hydrolase (TIGR01490 family)
MTQSSLAIFDLDGTLIPIDSDHAWGEFMVQKGWVDEKFFREANDRFFLDYQQGSLDVSEYLNFALSVLKREPAVVWQERRDLFVTEVILPHLLSSTLTEVFAVLTQHRQLNDRLLLITATNLFVARPIARLFGFDEMLSVDPVILDQHYTGTFVGVPTFANGKVTALYSWLSSQGLTLTSWDRSYFYSDSFNDFPLLSLVTDPRVVSPDNRLSSHAQAQRWPILDWFK